MVTLNDRHVNGKKVMQQPRYIKTDKVNIYL